jgi:hypothetical protein
MQWPPTTLRERERERERERDREREREIITVPTELRTRNWAKIAELRPSKLLEDDVALLLDGAVCLKFLHA